MVNHVVLGANGVVGRETVRALVERGITPAAVDVRPFSLAPYPSSPTCASRPMSPALCVTRRWHI